MRWFFWYEGIETILNKMSINFISFFGSTYSFLLKIKLFFYFAIFVLIEERPCNFSIGVYVGKVINSHSFDILGRTLAVVAQR